MGAANAGLRNVQARLFIIRSLFFFKTYLATPIPRTHKILKVHLLNQASIRQIIIKEPPHTHINQDPQKPYVTLLYAKCIIYKRGSLFACQGCWLLCMLSFPMWGLKKSLAHPYVLFLFIIHFCLPCN